MEKHRKLTKTWWRRGPTEGGTWMCEGRCNTDCYQLPENRVFIKIWWNYGSDRRHEEENKQLHWTSVTGRITYISIAADDVARLQAKAQMLESKNSTLEERFSDLETRSRVNSLRQERLPEGIHALFWKIDSRSTECCDSTTSSHYWEGTLNRNNEVSQLQGQAGGNCCYTV